MAVKLRRLAPDEAQRAFPRRGQQDLSDYMAAMGELQPGEAAAIEREGLSDRAIKRRLGAAAKQLGYRLKMGAAAQPRGTVLPGHRRTSRPVGQRPPTATSHPTEPRASGSAGA